MEFQLNLEYRRLVLLDLLKSLSPEKDLKRFSNVYVSNQREGLGLNFSPTRGK